MNLINNHIDNNKITIRLYIKKYFFINTSITIFLHRNLNYSISLSGMFAKSLYCIRAIIVHL
ncbi:hypothetical protein PFTANZ_06442 [Plasmodium falciparum Tanzania (2000708)]|uniref:Uncharacterized protein n=1 Tax=Plasmodium falciparum Tanzania (2000708) TaxID=1036725 RepID=A0A024VWZ3_PLAFA|nr:hypothetical protein PFTANZ_06442 [Plasmodium falciparum Tanzania (2000708)]